MGTSAACGSVWRTPHENPPGELGPRARVRAARNRLSRLLVSQTSLEPLEHPTAQKDEPNTTRQRATEMGRWARTVFSHWKMQIPQKLCEHCTVCALVIASKQMAQRSSCESSTVCAVAPAVSPARSPVVTGPIRREKRRYIPTMDQSDARIAGIFPRWTNQTQEAQVYCHNCHALACGDGGRSERGLSRRCWRLRAVNRPAGAASRPAGAA
eukprot:2741336-Pyramimonas_sp.AAC.1